MGFLERKNSRRSQIPDLSRYQNQNTKQEYNYLSANAANQALRTYSLNSNSYQGARNGSLTNGTRYQNRANSLTGYQRNNSIRSNSLRSNSITSNRANSLRNDGMTIVHTTKTLDEYGRLKSITTETIRKMGSFELIKTENKEIPLKPLKHKRSNDGLLSPPMVKYAGSLTSSQHELESIAEDDEIRFPEFHRGQAHSQAQNIEDTPEREQVGSDSESGNSIYSDAFETLPKEKKEQNQLKSIMAPPKATEPKVKKKVVVDDSASILSRGSRTSRGSKYKDYSVNYWQPNEKVVKKRISQQEMYETAYQLALGKVYGENQQRQGQYHANDFEGDQGHNQGYDQEEEEEEGEYHPEPKETIKPREQVIPPQQKGFRSYSLRSKPEQVKFDKHVSTIGRTPEIHQEKQNNKDSEKNKDKGKGKNKPKKKFNLFKLFKIK